MKRKYVASLSVESINQLVKDINEYRDSILPSLIDEFVSRLADVGIQVAKSTVSTDKGARPYIAFTKQVAQNEEGVTGLVLLTETGQIHVTWETLDGQKSADVSPLLMTEFGSGKFAGKAIVLSDGVSAGRGTFPNQTHAFDKNGWYYFNETGIHHSYGWKPTRPVFNAWMEMQQQIIGIANSVFQ